MRRIRPSRLTIRARLTLVYGGLFFAAGLALLGVTYLLVAQQVPGRAEAHIQNESGPLGPTSSPPPTTVTSTVLDAGQTTRQEALAALLTRGGLALAVVGAAATGFGWLIAGRLLQPLQRVTETARRIADAPAADRGLHERIALDGPHDEVKELADTFDVMLERLDHSFDGQRRFIANASHELRTPLTLNRALLEVAVDPATATPEIRQLGTTLMAVNTRHERLIDGLLLLARSEREVTQHAFVDLADIAEHVAEQVPPGAAKVATQTAQAETTGNPVLLERLVQNLVENAVRYNVSEDGWVRVTTAARPDGRVELQVSNTGPVIARYEVPSLFEPFHRVGGDRLAGPPGAGLGLSIVRAVAQAHGGEVTAEPRDTGGLVVTVILPGVR